MSNFVVDELEAGAAGNPSGYAELLDYWQDLLTGDFDTSMPLNSFSQAYESVHIVKPGRCMVFGIHAYNSNAATQFIQIFDTIPNAAGGLTAGQKPQAFWSVATASSVDVSYIFPGRMFLQGCIIANSSTGPTYTAGAADCWFDVQFV